MLFTAAFTSSLFILWTKTVETFPPLLFSHGNLPVCSTTSSELDLKLSRTPSHLVITPASTPPDPAGASSQGCFAPSIVPYYFLY